LNIVNEPFERVATIKTKSTLAFVGVRADDLDTTPFRVLRDNCCLILSRVFLVLG
jgi:hypothetical protein